MSRRPFRADLIVERQIYTPYSAAREIGMTPKAYYRLIDEGKLATTSPDVYRFSGQQLRECREGRALPSIERRSKHSRGKSTRQSEDIVNIPGI